MCAVFVFMTGRVAADSQTGARRVVIGFQVSTPLCGGLIKKNLSNHDNPFFMRKPCDCPTKTKLGIDPPSRVIFVSIPRDHEPVARGYFGQFIHPFRRAPIAPKKLVATRDTQPP